ncbi:hypothetical protein F5Y15DRAFT_24046 [Xylariaceae sp. FL0016]|nr:hypothetical protein F5Y15DRAFT_24046 [Xylariaceae sp. FL0016]
MSSLGSVPLPAVLVSPPESYSRPLAAGKKKNVAASSRGSMGLAESLRRARSAWVHWWQAWPGMLRSAWTTTPSIYGACSLVERSDDGETQANVLQIGRAAPRPSWAAYIFLWCIIAGTAHLTLPPLPFWRPTQPVFAPCSQATPRHGSSSAQRHKRLVNGAEPHLFFDLLRGTISEGDEASR